MFTAAGHQRMRWKKKITSYLKSTAVVAVGEPGEKTLRRLREESRPNKTCCLGSYKKEDAEGKQSLVKKASVSDLDPSKCGANNNCSGCFC